MAIATPWRLAKSRCECRRIGRRVATPPRRDDIRPCSSVERARLTEVAGSNPAGGSTECGASSAFTPRAGHVSLSRGSRKGVPPPPVGRNALRIVAQSVARPAGGRVDAGSKPAGTPARQRHPCRFGSPSSRPAWERWRRGVLLYHSHRPASAHPLSTRRTSTSPARTFFR